MINTARSLGRSHQLPSSPSLTVYSAPLNFCSDISRDQAMYNHLMAFHTTCLLLIHTWYEALTTFKQFRSIVSVQFQGTIKSNQTD